MSIPPPLSMALPLQQRFIPGIWPWFIERANRALDDGNVAWVSSWWRSLEANSRARGAERSQHLLGLALDVSPGRATEEAFRRAGFVVIPEGSHTHVQVYPAGTIPLTVFRAVGVAI